MWIQIHDAGDGVTYMLDLSREEALEVCFMDALRKQRVELPSVGGHASFNRPQVRILYQPRPGEGGTIYAPLAEFRRAVDAALREQREQDAEDAEDAEDEQDD